uniref:Uncharacterized protein n=1 Tax=Vespula pensylvanica TaxID=30213 RepID=A0A834JL57_VESPE|nr:hypothetical protein H0235_017725 [Vespula pensylvanica]
MTGTICRCHSFRARTEDIRIELGSGTEEVGLGVGLGWAGSPHLSATIYSYVLCIHSLEGARHRHFTPTMLKNNKSSFSGKACHLENKDNNNNNNWSRLSSIDHGRPAEGVNCVESSGH